MDKPILVTGATGYIGGRLVPQLLERGYRVRCFVRNARRLTGHDWYGRVEAVEGDVLASETLPAAMEGCKAAYYLIHSMTEGESGFEDRDRKAAKHFADAAGNAGLDRVVYLGGLGKRSEDLSAHLESRHEVGDVLRAGSVPVTELRAAMIIGSGSASFEMMRYLVSRLPVMICPKWVETRSQPIAIRDVLAYLVGTLTKQEMAGQIYDIGGPDILTYREMMMRFAKILGLKRKMIVVPVLTPRLSAHWVNLVTPIPAGLAFPLVEGLKSEMVCEDRRILEVIKFEPIGFDKAVSLAMERTRLNQIQTRWTDASLNNVPAAIKRAVAFNGENFPIKDEQTVEANVSAPVLFDRVQRIGGTVGWYYAEPLWEVRGALDRLIGGVGLRRGRRDPERVRIGDALDFWRVEDFVPNERLLLHAEMKVPGDAWLEFRVRSIDSERSELIQTAYFLPSNIVGKAYWHALFPLHWFIFRNMAKNIVKAAESGGGSSRAASATPG